MARCSETVGALLDFVEGNAARRSSFPDDSGLRLAPSRTVNESLHPSRPRRTRTPRLLGDRRFEGRRSKTLGPSIAAWPGPEGDEYALAFDRGRERRLPVLPALFDEANKLRRIHGRGHGAARRGRHRRVPARSSGCNESRAPLERQTLSGWETGSRAAAAHFGATHLLRGPRRRLLRARTASPPCAMRRRPGPRCCARCCARG